MHFCAFGLLPKFNTRYNVNLMFAKSLFSEICTQKAHLPIRGLSWGAYPPGRKVLRTGCAGLHPAAKVESVLKVEPKSKRSQSRRGIPYLKVELGLHYALLFHDSGIYPVFLTILHGNLFYVEGYFLMMTA